MTIEKIAIEKLVSDFAKIGSSHYSFAQTITALMADHSGYEVAQAAAQAAAVYFESVVRPAYQTRDDVDNAPTKFEGMTEYKVAVDAIRYGSGLLEKIAGYKITGNKKRVSFPDWVAGKEKEFHVEKPKAKKAPAPVQKDKGIDKAPLVQTAIGTEDKAAILEQYVEAATWETMVEQAMEKAIQSGELSRLVEMVGKRASQEAEKLAKVAKAKEANKAKAAKAKAEREARTAAHAAELAAKKANGAATVQ